MYIVAIDPDKEKSGIAVLNTETRKVKCYLLNFFDVCQTIKNSKHKDVFWILEGGFLTKNLQHKAINKNVAFKIGVDVGINHCIGLKFKEFLEINKINFTITRPLKKIWENGKISKKELINLLITNKLTIDINHNLTTNQDVRDALLLVIDYIKKNPLNLFF